MKKNFFLIVLFIECCSPGYSQSRPGSSPFPSEVHRIVFLGNSITYAGHYITDVESYLITKYPELNAIEFINLGLPSETVSGLSEEGHAGGKFARPDLHERLERVLTKTKPDLVFACYGMNDGIYLPQNEERFKKFKEGITWLHNTATITGTKIIHLTPPVYDDAKGKHPGYGAVLDVYSDWLLAQRTAAQWEVIDIHYPMKRFLERKRQADSTFALADDGIHPGAVGHWIIAQQILIYLGESGAAKPSTSVNELLASPHHVQARLLVSRQQAMMKDAWLTAIGHQRPGMKTGLPLDEATINFAVIEKEIKTLLQR